MKYLVGTIVILFTFLTGTFVGARSILNNIDRYVPAPAPVVNTVEITTTKYVDRIIQTPAPAPAPAYHKASYAEVVQFLKDDKTNLMQYNSKTFDCKDFASTLKENANQKGILCASAALDYVNYDSSSPAVGHTINAFDTSDRNIIFVEPQRDVIVDGVSLNADYDYLLSYSQDPKNAKESINPYRISHITLTW